VARDPGLQPERTALAWQRTGVTGSLVGGVGVLAAAHRGSEPLVVIAALLAAVGAAAAGYAYTRPQPALHRGLPFSPWGRLVATASVSVLVGIIGALLALAP